MIEINGHWIDENKVSYISPVHDWRGIYFHIIVDTELILLEFEEEEAAKEAHSKCVTICCNVVR